MTRMTFVGTLEGRQHTVVVDDDDRIDHQYRVSVDGKEFEVDAHTMKSEIVTALVDHKSYDIDLDRMGNPNDTLDGRVAVRVRGRVVQLDMLDERRAKLKEAQATRFADAGLQRVTSPMPGKIMRIQVAPGTQVKQGQGLAVMEAMKMENELRAPKDGVVKEVLAKPGDSVDGGALLITIE